MMRIAVLIATISLTSPALGQDGRLQRLRDYFKKLSSPPKAATETAPAPSLASLLDGNTFVQVNVNANGNNVVGDAANEATIAVDPTSPNQMVIGWRQFDTVLSSFRQAGVAWTNDGGRTWHFDGPIDPGSLRSDPVLASDANGVFYYYAIHCTTTGCGDLFKSYDGGKTWNGPIFAFGGDKVWLTVDQTTHNGNVYAQWDDNLIRSIDGGTTFEPPINIPGNPHWGSICVDPDGLVYVVGISSGRRGFPVARSSSLRDPSVEPNFESLSHADLEGNIFGFGGPNPDGLLGQAWIAADHSNTPARGNVYVCASVRTEDSNLDVTFTRSTDQGQTWSAPVRINDDPAGTDAMQWFATMSVAPNGRIDVIWNDTRHTVNQSVSELFYSFSTDQGITWSTNVALSPAWDSHLGWPLQKKIGDYYHMVSDNVGANLAWAATFNGEQDVYYLRIGDYDCNGNGIGDTIDFLSGAATDYNSNGIPDACDIASGSSQDANSDGVPDECCYADCDTASGAGMLDLGDFLCFQAAFLNAEPYACNCDTVSGPGVCDIADFLCYQNAYIAGCP